MSKLSHSHQPSMNRIERDRLVATGIMPEPGADDIEGGYFCAICWRPLAEETGRPCACVECGGDADIDEDAVAEIIGEHGQLGVGA
jgi:hypothetical protein